MNWATARKAALERDEYLCQKCLRPATQVHHRRPKQSGGTSDEEIKFGLANLISLCLEDHAWIHAHPKISYEQGWLVHSWQRPEDVPWKPTLTDEETYEF